MLVYNIPYRTGVNLGNEAMLRLAAHQNIVGLKDCGADRGQSLDLLRRRPQHFAVLTGPGRIWLQSMPLPILAGDGLYTRVDGLGVHAGPAHGANPLGKCAQVNLVVAIGKLTKQRGKRIQMTQRG